MKLPNPSEASGDNKQMYTLLDKNGKKEVGKLELNIIIDKPSTTGLSLYLSLSCVCFPLHLSSDRSWVIDGGGGSGVLVLW
jgi:hypothetical protein